MAGGEAYSASAAKGWKDRVDGNYLWVPVPVWPKGLKLRGKGSPGGIATSRQSVMRTTPPALRGRWRTGPAARALFSALDPSSNVLIFAGLPVLPSQGKELPPPWRTSEGSAQPSS